MFDEPSPSDHHTSFTLSLQMILESMNGCELSLSLQEKHTRGPSEIGGVSPLCPQYFPDLFHHVLLIPCTIPLVTVGASLGTHTRPRWCVDFSSRLPRLLREEGAYCYLRLTTEGAAREEPWWLTCGHR